MYPTLSSACPVYDMASLSSQKTSPTPTKSSALNGFQCLMNPGFTWLVLEVGPPGSPTRYIRKHNGNMPATDPYSCAVPVKPSNAEPSTLPAKTNSQSFLHVDTSIETVKHKFSTKFNTGSCSSKGLNYGLSVDTMRPYRYAMPSGPYHHSSWRMRRLLLQLGWRWWSCYQGISMPNMRSSFQWTWTWTRNNGCSN